jgi:hypothetical protein
MPVPFMVAEKQVLAVLRVMTRPVLFGDFDSGCRRVLDIFVGNMKFV